MRVKQIQETNFQDYCKASMLIATCFCDGKCWKERGLKESDCHNEALLAEPIIDIPDVDLGRLYMDNPLTEAIIIAGLEPLLQFDEVMAFIKVIRETYNCNDDIVIYTGYKEEEAAEKVAQLQKFPNIIVKFGRYNPYFTNTINQIDSILGIKLATINQYAKKIS